MRQPFNPFMTPEYVAQGIAAELDMAQRASVLSSPEFVEVAKEIGTDDVDQSYTGTHKERLEALLEEMGITVAANMPDEIVLIGDRFIFDDHGNFSYMASEIDDDC